MIQDVARVQRLADNNKENGDLEAALMNYVVISNTLLWARQLNLNLQANCCSSSDNNKKTQQIENQCLQIDNRLNTVLAETQNLQNQLREKKELFERMQSNAPGAEEDLSNLKCESIQQLVLSGKECIGFDDVVGLDSAKTALENAFVYPLLYPNLYGKQAKGILLYGPPGTGKTFLMKAAVTRLQQLGKGKVNVLFFAPTGADLKGKFVGETEKNIIKYFNCASRAAQNCMDNNAGTKVISIIFIDEIDSIASDRSKDDTGIIANAVNTLLQVMDGIKSVPNVAVAAATNFPWKLDSAIDRRFTEKIYLTIPNALEISQTIKSAILRHVTKPELGYATNTAKLQNNTTCIKKNKVPEEKSKDKEKSKDTCGNDSYNCSSICVPKVPDNKPLDNIPFVNLTEAELGTFAENLIKNSKKTHYSSSDITRLIGKVQRKMAEKARVRGVFSKITIEEPTQYMSVLSIKTDKDKEIVKKAGDLYYQLKVPQYPALEIEGKIFYNSWYSKQSLENLMSTYIKDIYIRDYIFEGDIKHDIVFSYDVKVIGKENKTKTFEVYAVYQDINRLGDNNKSFFGRTIGSITSMLYNTEKSDDKIRIDNISPNDAFIKLLEGSRLYYTPEEGKDTSDVTILRTECVRQAQLSSYQDTLTEVHRKYLDNDMIIRINDDIENIKSPFVYNVNAEPGEEEGTAIVNDRYYSCAIKYVDTFEKLTTTERLAEGTLDGNDIFLNSEKNVNDEMLFTFEFDISYFYQAINSLEPDKIQGTVRDSELQALNKFAEDGTVPSD